MLLCGEVIAFASKTILSLGVETILRVSAKKTFKYKHGKFRFR